VTTISDLPPQRTGLFHDLTHIKFRYVVLVLACIGAGSYLRSEIFSGGLVTSVEKVTRTDSFLKVRGPDHWETTQKNNAAFIANLADGTSPGEVIEALGKPQFDDAYSNNVEIMYYRTHHEHDDLYTTRDETTPLVFIDGKLVNHSRSAHGPAFDKSSANGSDHWSTRQDENATAIAMLKPGENRSDIIEKLGRPDFDDIVNSDFEVLSYRTRSVKSDGYTTREETTPLVFRREKLIAIGNAGASAQDKTPPPADDSTAPDEHPVSPPGPKSPPEVPGKGDESGTGSF